MLESQEPTHMASKVKIAGVKPALLGIAIVYALATLCMLFVMNAQVTKIKTSQAATVSAIGEVNERIDAEVSTMQARTLALGEKLGMTEKHLQARSAELRRQQLAISRLEKQEAEQFASMRKENQEQMAGVKGDISSTRSDLEATKQKLERTIGDLGAQSGLIAHTREDLEILRHRGDRNYYEFTLYKAKRPTRVSTVSLQLKKANPRKGKFTLDVIADDHDIEKKDRTMFEPLQFYSGRDRQLLEVVIFEVNRNKVAGYLSAPKPSAAQAQSGE